MADNIDITPGSGKTVHTDEKTLNSVSAHIQRMTVAAGETLSVSIISQSTTGADALAANNSRLYAQILPIDGDIYIGSATGNLASDTTRRKVRAGIPWETQHYLGVISIKAVTGTVTVEVEEIS
jgi:negative regulator of sigma E activity